MSQLETLEMLLVLLFVPLVSAQMERPAAWNFPEPVRVCTASIQDFGARCDGTPYPSLRDRVHPLGKVPAQGWCPFGEKFCGYDVSVFRCEHHLHPAQLKNVDYGTYILQETSSGVTGAHCIVQALRCHDMGTCDIVLSMELSQTEQTSLVQSI
jgi:hypothetical protein